jgi:hypothetical protein
MALINVTRKAETIQAFQLTTPADMMTALTYLVDHMGYTGSVMNSPGVWQLNFQTTTNNQSQTGHINDWVIITNNTLASICSAADAPDLYQAT